MKNAPDLARDLGIKAESDVRMDELGTEHNGPRRRCIPYSAGG